MKNAFALLALIFITSSAYAARSAVVDVETDLLTVPKNTASSVTRLKKGTKVAASNYPTEGYYKVRTPEGTLGWVKGNTLILGPMPDLTPGK